MSPQNKVVLDYMRLHNGITTYEAFDKLKITRLSARIKELKDDEGCLIVKERKVSKNSKPYMVYRLMEEKA